MLSKISRKCQKQVAVLLIGGASLFSAGAFDLGCSGGLDDVWGNIGGFEFGSAQTDDGMSYDDDWNEVYDLE